jgi:aldehyde dehydrogenase (NAD+)
MSADGAASRFPAGWALAPAPESPGWVHIPPVVGHWIDGALQYTGALRPTVNPATGATLAQVHQGGAEEVDEAVRAASMALPAWQALTGLERGKLLFRLSRLIQEHARELAILETLDNGKPIRESRDVDVPLAASHFFYYAGWADKLDVAFRGAPVRPVGVCAHIIPWNFPLLMAAWKLAPALATGNTCVLKPAETSPLSAHRLMELVAEAGFPPGVINVVHGDGVAGQALVAHPGIHKVAFTGSTDVGRAIQASLAGRCVRLTLELGGKGAHIIFEDAALEQAVEGVVQGIFFNQGQVCCAGSRLLVQESIREEFLARLQRRMSLLRMGNPLDKNTDVGAIHSAEQFARVQQWLNIGAEEGVEAWSAPGCAVPERGWYIPPTLLLGATAHHRVAREEIFGPLLAVLPFRSPEEAVALANNTRFGLSAGLWTRNAGQARHVAGQLRAGVVWVNTFQRFDPSSPFGGFGESGHGREGGLAGLWPWMEVVP